MSQQNLGRVVALCADAKLLKNLAGQVTKKFEIIFFRHQRLFLQLKNQDINMLNEQIQSVGQVGFPGPVKIGTGVTPARALLFAKNCDCGTHLDFEACSISFVFDYLSPFYNDVIDLKLQSSILDWLENSGVKTFGDFRALLKKGLPKQIEFLGERFFEAETEVSTFENTFENKTGPQSPFDQFVARMQNQIGSQSIFAAHFQKQSPETSSHSDQVKCGNSLRRASRVLPVPVPLFQFEKRLVAPTHQWIASSWSAPRRVKESQGNFILERDYFEVRTMEGDELWIFRDLASGLLYWHGLFD